MKKERNFGSLNMNRNLLNKILTLILFSLLISLGGVFQSNNMSLIANVYLIILVVSSILWRDYLKNKRVKIKNNKIIIRNSFFPIEKSISALQEVKMCLPFWQFDKNKKAFGLNLRFEDQKNIKTGPIFDEEQKKVRQILEKLQEANPKIRFDKFIEDFLRNGYPNLFIEENYGIKKRIVGVIKGIVITLIIFAGLTMFLTLIITLFRR